MERISHVLVLSKRCEKSYRVKVRWGVAGLIWWATVCACTVTPPARGGGGEGRHSLHHPSLHHFELLHTHQLQHRDVIRGQRSLVVSTLNRTFELLLSPRRGLFLDGAAVYSVDARGNRTRHVLDVSHFYSGEVADEEYSQVSAHLDGKTGILTAAILTKDEHYFIEPSFRHFDESHDFHMISYRRSDLKYKDQRTPSSSCGTHVAGSFSAHFPPVYRSDSSSSSNPLPKSAQFRRQATPLVLDSCPMHLVATGNFHRAHSNRQSVESTVLFMIQVIDSVDQHIFRPVEWDMDKRHYGLTIKNITVYEAPDYGPPYNSARAGGWSSSQLLQLFSHRNWSQFCLAHLFAFQTFTDNRAGVAYTASEKNLPGGICSEAQLNSNGGPIATPNVGLSSFRGGGGRVLLLAEGRLITAHEIGHNWGSGHDPTTTRGDPCNPGLSSTAGKFLMFPSMTDGTQPNNDDFSICSKVMISRVLSAKSSRCFINRGDVDECGNYEVDGDDEECDAGLQGTLGLDPCCTANCRLKPGKACSDGNDVCCTNCSISDVDKVCRVFSHNNSQCKANVSCDGVRETCPQPEDPFVKVNSSCRGLGKCLVNGSLCNTSGVCVGPPPSPYVSTVECYDLCRLHGKSQCFCNDTNECHFCCRDTSSSPCLVVAPLVNLPDGTSCVGGLCSTGTCIPTSQDLIHRLFDLFTNISIDKFVQFLSENIVATVLFVVTVFWVIVGTPIHIFDRLRFNQNRDKMTELDKQRFGCYHEDHCDHAHLEAMALVTPDIDISSTRKALVRMGSTIDTISSQQEISFQGYSISTGYVSPVSGAGGAGAGGAGAGRANLLGRRRSHVLEHSKYLDPSKDDILQHILLTEQA